MVKPAARAETVSSVQAEARPGTPLRAWIALGVAALVLLAGLIAPPLPGLSPTGTRTLGVLLGAIVLWASGAWNPTLVALGMMLAWPLLGIMSFTEAAAGYGSSAVWLMISILLLSVAFVHCGLDRRIVYRLLYLARGETRGTLLWVVLALLVLTVLVPTAAGRAGIMLGISQGMMRVINLPRGSNVGKALFILVAYVTLYSSLGVLTGAIVIVFAAGLFQELAGYSWEFLSWMLVGGPPVVVASLLLWAVLLRLYPPEVEVLEGGREYLRERIKELGAPSVTERKMMLIIAAMLLAWMSEPWHGLDTHMVALMALLAVFFPPYPVMPLEEALTRMQWNVALLFGASLSITGALQRSQVPAWLGSGLERLPLADLPPLAIGLAFMLLSLVMRLGFPNAIALVAALLPVTIVVAGPLGVNPVWLGMLTLVPTQLPLLPMVSPGAAILYSGGYFSISDMLRAGLLVAATVIGVTLIFAQFYWPMVGLGP